MILRPYQQQCVTQSMEGWNEFRKQFVSVPTGGGKAVMMAKMAEAVSPKKTLMLCHREELIEQSIDKLFRATGIRAEKEKAESRASLNAQVVAASVQTMQGERLQRWPKDHFGLVICDEAHHSISNSWQATLRHFDEHAWVWGCTATPDRSDKRNLGSYYENIAFEISLLDLINQGYLSRISVQSVPIQIDISKVRQTTGDYNESDLSDAIVPYMKAIAQSISQYAAFRRTLVFLPLCATSRLFVEVCQSEGLSAAHIDGNSPDRKEILERYAASAIDVLCNAMLLTEGFDDPGIDCVVILRPTKSRSLYSQMVGRGTRIFPFKKDLLLLDLLWLHEKHNLIRPAHLIATSEDHADIITKLAEEKSRAGKQEELDLQGLASEAQIKREKKLQEELKAKAKRTARSIDAMEFCLSLHATDVAEWEDVSPWHKKSISDRQRDMLAKNGIDVDSLKSKGHASAVIDLIIERSKHNLATPKQVRYLQRFGYPNPHTVSFKDASEFLDKKFKGKVMRAA